MKSISRHFQHYAPLLGIFAVGIFGIYTFSYDIGFQFVVLIASSVSYVMWGVIHHYIHRDLSLVVIIEYFAVSVLGIVIASSIMLNT